MSVVKDSDTIGQFRGQLLEVILLIDKNKLDTHEKLKPVLQKLRMQMYECMHVIDAATQQADVKLSMTDLKTLIMNSELNLPRIRITLQP